MLSQLYGSLILKIKTESNTASDHDQMFILHSHFRCQNRCLSSDTADSESALDADEFRRRSLQQQQQRQRKHLGESNRVPWRCNWMKLEDQTQGDTVEWCGMNQGMPFLATHLWSNICDFQHACTQSFIWEENKNTQTYQSWFTMVHLLRMGQSWNSTWIPIPNANAPQRVVCHMCKEKFKPQLPSIPYRKMLKVQGVTKPTSNNPAEDIQ